MASKENRWQIDRNFINTRQKRELPKETEYNTKKRLQADDKRKG